GTRGSAHGQRRRAVAKPEASERAERCSFGPSVDFTADRAEAVDAVGHGHPRRTVPLSSRGLLESENAAGFLRALGRSHPAPEGRRDERFAAKRLLQVSPSRLLPDEMKRPLLIDLYCGLGGWAEGALAEGYDVIGFDIERHEYSDHRYPAQLVLQDVSTLH